MENGKWKMENGKRKIENGKSTSLGGAVGWVQPNKTG